MTKNDKIALVLVSLCLLILGGIVIENIAGLENDSSPLRVSPGQPAAPEATGTPATGQTGRDDISGIKKKIERAGLSLKEARYWQPLEN